MIQPSRTTAPVTGASSGIDAAHDPARPTKIGQTVTGHAIAAGTIRADLIKTAEGARS